MMSPFRSVADAMLVFYIAIACVLAVILLAAAGATAIDTRFARRPFSAWAASFLLLGEAIYTAGLASDEALGAFAGLVCGLLVVAPTVFILARHALAIHVAALGHLSAVVAATSLATKMETSIALVYLFPVAVMVAAGLLLTRSSQRSTDGER